MPDEPGAESPQLSSAIASAWGLVPTARRGPRAELSLASIVKAAIGIGDRGGLAAVSMARVADELGFTTMSLYRHVGSKDELLVHVQDEVLGAPPTGLEGDNWRWGLEQWTHALMAAYSVHAWALALPISGPPLMPRAIAWLDRALAIMANLELSSMEKLSTVLLLSGYARNEVSLATSLSAVQSGNASSDTSDEDYEAQLRHLVHPDRLPALHRMLNAGALFDHSPTEQLDDPDRFFVDFGLARILDGIEVHAERARG